MESDLQQHSPVFLDHHHQQHQQMNSGLTRFRSAPSSYFSNIIDREFYEHLFNKPSSPETERIFARFMNSLGGGGDAAEPESAALAQNLSTVQQQQQQQLPSAAAVKEEVDQQSQAMPSNEPVVLHQLQQQQQQQSNINNYGSSAPPPQSFYQSSGRPPLPNQMKTGRGNTSNLIRHGSSPAGLFSNINIDSGMSNFFFLFCLFFFPTFFFSLQGTTVFLISPFSFHQKKKRHFISFLFSPSFVSLPRTPLKKRVLGKTLTNLLFYRDFAVRLTGR